MKKIPFLVLSICCAVATLIFVTNAPAATGVPSVANRGLRKATVAATTSSPTKTKSKTPTVQEPFVQGSGHVDRSQSVERRSPVVDRSVHHDVSRPLRDVPPAIRQLGEHEDRVKLIPRRFNYGAFDPVVQRSSLTSSTRMPSTANNFDGVGAGFRGPAGTFSVSSAPPDTNGDVGPNHYVQIVNSDFAIFNKSGTALYGPVPINTLWSGFGGGCEVNNDGDPVAVYDRIADRWIISQFSVTTTPYLQCVAVSQTADPTGAYNRYSFQYTDFPDYPKMGVWPDAYYITFNMFAGGTTFSGGTVCAYDRSKMLAGQAATQQCFNVGTSFGGMLPSSLDGAQLPPSGSPNYVLALGASANQLAFWKFHVDWATPSNSTLTGPTTLATAAFSEACGGSTCIPQSGTTQQLDSLADRLMYRLSYRNFGDHEALVVNHSVTAGSSTGARWYEIRSPGSTPTIFQQGTYAPDSNYRWMGSIAMDQSGNMALGFSVSGSSIHPQIHYVGRLAGDPLGQMPQGEATIIDGAGSQTGSNLSRWGDYSKMAVDPTDDCTFWYTSEYIPAAGAFNWKTRIGSFKFPGCGGVVTNDFSISASPTSLSLVQNSSGTSNISTAVTAGSAGTISLTVAGMPAGSTASLNPTSVTAGNSSTLTVNAGTAAAGSYTLTVTGTEGSKTHTTTVTVTVTAPTVNDFSISANPTSLSIAQGSSATSTISTAVTSGSAGTVSLAVSGVPSGASASLSPTSVTAGGSSTLTVNAGTAAAGSYTLTVTGTEGSNTHSTTVSVTVTASTGSTIVNGGFETGNLAPWTSTGTTAVVTGGHSGSYSARVGNTSPTNGDSSISQTFTVPSGGGTLTFWYQVHCPDTLTYDWAVATVKDNVTGSTTTILPKTCTNAGTWVQVSYNLGASANHSVTLTLTSHDDNYATDPTYTLYDDVAVGAGPPPPPPSPIVNGGFESGLTGWTSTGSTSVSTTAHSGSSSAQVGSTGPGGDSSLSQTFTVSAGLSQLSFWYQVHCPDTVTYDWAIATLKDNTTGTTATVLAKTCTNAGTWVQATSIVTAGHSYTLTLSNHDDNYPSDPTYTLYDDATVK